MKHRLNRCISVSTQKKDREKEQKQQRAEAKEIGRMSEKEERDAIGNLERYKENTKRNSLLVLTFIE